MMEMLTLVLLNLRNVGIGLVLFVLAYLANMLFAMWRNTKLLGQPFDKRRLRDSGLKLLCFGGGLVLLCVVMTALPLFADMVGWEIPEQYQEVFSAIVIVGVFLLASCKYLLEAFKAMKAILFPEGES